MAESYCVQWDCLIHSPFQKGNHGYSLHFKHVLTLKDLKFLKEQAICNFTVPLTITDSPIIIWNCWAKSNWTKILKMVGFLAIWRKTEVRYIIAPTKEKLQCNCEGYLPCVSWQLAD